MKRVDHAFLNTLVTVYIRTFFKITLYPVVSTCFCLITKMASTLQLLSWSDDGLNIENCVELGRQNV